MSVLPTTRWTDACTEVATQLEDRDEFLLIHDVKDDPITERQHTPEGVRLIAAGGPKRCSGKVNAIAAGMAAARHDRLVWTDDDFHHPPDWLATLSANYENVDRYQRPQRRFGNREFSRYSREDRGDDHRLT